MTADPMSLTQDLDFVGMVGIIDPLRAEAKEAVHTALGAGIDVRMITGDHAVTAEAIGEELGLGPGAISGSELQALSDEELARRLPELHVFGRVSPEDKLRLARVMQEQGLDRRDDRRRGQRCCRVEAGRHRRGDGLGKRGDQAGGADDPHRRQLRHARQRGADRPARLRQDRLVRPVPDDAAVGARHVVRRGDDLRRQRGCRADAADGAVPARVRHRGRRRRDRARSRRS